MKHHCRAFRVSPATRLGHFAGKIGNWIALQGAFGRSSPGPKLFDAATGSNSRGLFAATRHGSGDLQSRAGDRGRAVSDVKANTRNLRITLRSLSILDPYLRTIERSISIIILGL